MAKNNSNIRVYNSLNCAVWTAPFGTAMPTTIASPPAAPASFYEVGLLSDAGITEAHSFNETDIYDMSGSLQRVARNQEQRPFTFEALEYNAIVGGLMYVNSTLSSAGGTGEVDTVTISGTPTGGTFNLYLPGIGALLNQPYNVPTATLITNILAAWDLTVTVTGTAGTSYVITLPAAAGNTAAMTATAAFTGGASPAIAVATTTPGVTGTNTRLVAPGLTSNRRAFIVDLVDATVSRRYCINNGEAQQSGTVSYTGSGAAVYQFTLQPYLDNFGNYFTILDNDPSNAETFS